MRIEKWTVQRDEIDVVDGDSLRLLPTRIVGDVGDWELLARRKDHKPLLVRLVHIDAPEKGQYGWVSATKNLQEWVDMIASAVVQVWAFPDIRDKYGRPHVDLYDEPYDPMSASEFMMRVKGWPPYGEKK